MQGPCIPLTCLSDVRCRSVRTEPDCLGRHLLFVRTPPAGQSYQWYNTPVCSFWQVFLLVQIPVFCIFSRRGVSQDQGKAERLSHESTKPGESRKGTESISSGLSNGVAHTTPPFACRFVFSTFSCFRCGVVLSNLGCIPQGGGT